MEGLGQRPKELKEEEPQRSLRRKGQKVGGRRRSPIGKSTGIFQKEHQQCQMPQEAWVGRDLGRSLSSGNKAP